MTKKKYAKGLMWFRRDLRACDNAALYHALNDIEIVKRFGRWTSGTFHKYLWDSTTQMHGAAAAMAAVTAVVQTAS